MKLGVLGGTFDPVHVGHLVLAEQAREQLSLERVLWLPSGDPWRKAGNAVSAGKHRLAMVRLAVEANPAFEVCPLELERPGPSYTVETLAALQAQRPEAELIFLLGLDALRDLPNWHQPERLIALAKFGVAPRDSERPLPEELDRLLAGLSARVLWVEMPRIEVSGTELRRRAAQGQSLRYLVPDAVERYVRDHKLYSA